MYYYSDLSIESAQELGHSTTVLLSAFTFVATPEGLPSSFRLGFCFVTFWRTSPGLSLAECPVLDCKFIVDFHGINIRTKELDLLFIHCHSSKIFVKIHVSELIFRKIR
jgi:hypothetical protein